MQFLEQKKKVEWEDKFHIEVEFPKFQGEVVDRSKIMLENFDKETAEMQAEGCNPRPL